MDLWVSYYLSNCGGFTPLLINLSSLALAVCLSSLRLSACYKSRKEDECEIEIYSLLCVFRRRR